MGQLVLHCPTLAAWLKSTFTNWTHSMPSLPYQPWPPKTHTHTHTHTHTPLLCSNGLFPHGPVCLVLSFPSVKWRRSCISSMPGLRDNTEPIICHSPTLPRASQRPVGQREQEASRIQEEPTTFTKPSSLHAFFSPQASLGWCTHTQGESNTWVGMLRAA
jgi:hypothetical protein